VVEIDILGSGTNLLVRHGVNNGSISLVYEVEKQLRLHVELDALADHVLHEASAHRWKISDEMRNNLASISEQRLDCNK